MKKSDTYLKLVEWSEDEQCYVGSAPPLIGPCCHGDDEAQVYRDLCRIFNEWIAIHEADGRALPEPLIPPNKEFSGRFLVRIDPSLHKSMAIRWMREAKSLNTFVAEKLASVS